MEKLGNVFEAMHLYRKAVQIVPDIEFKMYESATKQHQEEKLQNDQTNEDSLNANNETESFDDLNDNDNDDTNLEGVDLMMRFQIHIQKSGRLFQRATSLDKAVISTGLHFSDLPMEVILYILRWVVSMDLDLRSLDQCSMVSKGFYICAKDEEIWKLACLKYILQYILNADFNYCMHFFLCRIWGIQTGSLYDSSYLSWRQMYLERPKIHFNGCYISKTSYLRYGENNFQDQFYRPIHLIEYYRYIRFFPDGLIFMMTTPDDPAQSVGKLKTRSTNRTDVLRGHYR